MNFNIGQLIRSTYPGARDVCIIIKILPTVTKTRETSLDAEYSRVEYLPWNSNGKLSTAYLHPDIWKVIA